MTADVLHSTIGAIIQRIFSTFGCCLRTQRLFSEIYSDYCYIIHTAEHTLAGCLVAGCVCRPFLYVFIFCFVRRAYCVCRKRERETESRWQLLAVSDVVVVGPFFCNRKMEKDILVLYSLFCSTIWLSKRARRGAAIIFCLLVRPFVQSFMGILSFDLCTSYCWWVAIVHCVMFEFCLFTFGVWMQCNNNNHKLLHFSFLFRCLPCDERNAYSLRRVFWLKSQSRHIYYICRVISPHWVYSQS